MKQFSLVEYLKNPTRKVVTRDGRDVRIVCTDREHPVYMVVALVKTSKYYASKEAPMAYSAKGEFYAEFENDGATVSENDLFFAPSNKSAWVFLYKSSPTQIVSFACEDKGVAEHKMQELNGFGLTEITWEE